jgi:hypothetical protein
MTKIIAFAGRKQSGKTTSAELLVDYYKYALNIEEGIKIYNFADTLKRFCIDTLELTYDQCYGSDEQKNELVDCYWDNGTQMTAREVMQFVGTDVFRKMKNNIWSNATINLINKEKPKLAIIADCRFPNEVDAIKKSGGFVIKLMRNLFNSDHDSETALDLKNYNHKNFDLVIFNQNLSIEEKNHGIINFAKKKGLLQL